MSDKRKFPRYVISQMLPINFNNLEGVTFVNGINISKSGLLCDINVQLPIETDVYLMISLPDNKEEKKIEIQAKVVRVVKTVSLNIFRTALEFTFIEENNKKFLYDYIDSLRKTY